MGRQLRRVPLDFDWPLNEVWPGFYLSICNEMSDKKGRSIEDSCKLCRQFAQLASVPLKGDCPDVDVEPPTGDGYQLWETVSEGSPVSPVFVTPEHLAQWLTEPGNDTSITQDTNYEQWLKFIKGDGWAPSMVCSPEHGLESGVAAVARDT